MSVEKEQAPPEAESAGGKERAERIEAAAREVCVAWRMESFGAPTIMRLEAALAGPKPSPAAAPSLEVCEKPIDARCAGLDIPELGFCADHAREHEKECVPLRTGHSKLHWIESRSA